MALVGQNNSQREEYTDHIFPCTPQGGNISQLYPTCYSTRVYIGGIYVGVKLEVMLRLYNVVW